MPRGRRPGPGTAEEKAAARREKVRLNVQAYRKRKQAAEKGTEPPKEPNLKWVPGTKWQSEYDQSKKSEQSDADDEGSRKSSVVASPNWTSDYDDIKGLEIVAQTPTMYSTPGPGAQNSLAILGMFPERFLPTQLSLPELIDSQTLRTPCALWVTTATKQARIQGPGALNDVLHSIVLAVMGMENQRYDLQVEAQRLYTRSLNKTRRSLGPILSNNYKASQTSVLNLFLACHAAAVYELIVNGSMGDMLQHVRGIGLLIEHQRRMPDFPAVTGNSLIEEYRMMEIHFCLLERQLSTSYRMRRLTPEGAKSHRSAVADTEIGIIGTLLDLADEILPIMVELDTFKHKLGANAGQLMKLVHQALSLHSQFDSWSAFLHQHAFPSSPRSESSSDTHEPIDLSQITQYEWVSCYLFSLSYDLHAIEVCIEAVSALADRTANGSVVKPSAQIQLLRTKSLTVAGSILELMPYFFQNDKGIIGRSIAIWPLEAVWRVLDEESKRLSRDQQVSMLVDVSDDFKNKIKLNRELIERYYALCRKTGRSARGYGLPLLENRELEEGKSPSDSGRGESIGADMEAIEKLLSE